MLRHPALRYRTMLAFGLVSLVVAVVVVGVCLAVTRSTLVGSRERSAERQAFLNARAVRSSLSDLPSDRSGALATAQTSRDGSALLGTGSGWFSSSVSVGPGDLPDDLLGALDEGGASRQRIRIGDEPMVAVAVPIADADVTYVELVPLTDVEDAVGTVRRALLLAAGASVIAATLAGWGVSARVLRPVRRMADAADQIREGSLDRRLAEVGDADLAPLVRSFNAMVDGLQERIDREARFSSDVSHELRSPLATMTASLNVARRRADDPAVLDALAVLENEVSRFTELIDQLLEIGRAEAGVAELILDRVEPVPFVEAVLATTRHDVPVVVAPGAGPAARIDKRRMAQVLANLLDNAAYHGGGPTQLALDGDDVSLTISIDDAGPGVPEHERTQVFGRFARGRGAQAPGTGLGLALVREHVRLHGGAVVISDAPAGGARFTVTVPRGDVT